MTTSGWENWDFSNFVGKSWDFSNFVGKTSHQFLPKFFRQNFSSGVWRLPSNLMVVSSNPPWCKNFNFFSSFFSIFLYFHNKIMCLLSCKKVSPWQTKVWWFLPKSTLIKEIEIVVSQLDVVEIKNWDCPLKRNLNKIKWS